MIGSRSSGQNTYSINGIARYTNTFTASQTGSYMGIETSYLPFERFGNLLKTFSADTSLYQTLADQYGIHMHAADEAVEAGLVNAQDARLLGIRTGSPVFFFTRVSYLKSGRPIEFVRSVYRGDRFKIVNRLTHQSNLDSGWRRKYAQ